MKVWLSFFGEFYKFGFVDVVAVGNWQRKLPTFEESTASTRENRRFSRVWGLSQT